MDTSRRRFFGVGVAALAATVVPAAVAESNKPDQDATGPILLEHICDGGKSRYSPEEVRWSEEHGRKYWGCGTKFRWYFGVPPYCPNCGWAYETTTEIIKSGVYKRISG